LMFTAGFYQQQILINLFSAPFRMFHCVKNKHHYDF